MSILLDTFPHVRPVNSLQPEVFGCIVVVYNHSARGELDYKALKLCLQATLLFKRGTNVIAPLPENSLSRVMSLSLNISLYIRVPLFSGR